MKRLYWAAPFAGLLAAGCAGPQPAATMNHGADARFVAADDDFATGLPGAKATTRLDAVNGAPTGAWRLDRGAGASPAGPVHLLVGLRQQDKLLPFGAPDTFACIRLKAEPQTIYTVAAVLNGAQYQVVVHNTSFNPSQAVTQVAVATGQQATVQTCGKAD